jgi:two-component system cell cycle response regulator
VKDELDIALQALDDAEAAPSRVADDLHADAIQRLTAIALRIDLLMCVERRGQDAMQSELIRIRGDVAREIGSLRQLASQLRPPVLDEAVPSSGRTERRVRPFSRLACLPIHESMDGATRTVLLVDDSATQRAATAYHLGQMGYDVTTADGGHACLRLLGEVRADLVLLDVVLPDLDGWETLERIREFSAVPVIMLTSQGERLDRVRGLRAGADDYIAKPYEPDELDARIEAVLRRSRVARRDALTGLQNRRAFDEHVDTLMACSNPADNRFSVVLFDLDDFKQINDSEGHQAGDEVLRDVARVALREVRLGEEVFRIGGEEFAIVINGVGCEVGDAIANRLRHALAEQADRHLPTLSAGVAAYPANGTTKDELLGRADLALYAAKHSGKNAVALAA